MKFGGEVEAGNGIGGLFVVHIFVEIVAFVTREDVEVIMEGVLTPYGLVVLQSGDAVTTIDFFH